MTSLSQYKKKAVDQPIQRADMDSLFIAAVEVTSACVHIHDYNKYKLISSQVFKIN